MMHTGTVETAVGSDLNARLLFKPSLGDQDVCGHANECAVPTAMPQASCG